jgi:hypothetical protein
VILKRDFGSTKALFTSFKVNNKMKKLYKITIPGEAYVWASDEDDALCEGPFQEFSFESGFEPIAEEVDAEDSSRSPSS